MAKTSGGVRKLKTGSREYSARMLEVQRMKDSGLYSSVEFSEKGGGYVAIEKSSMKHTAEELEAAGFLADNGYKVILLNEAGSITTPDGYVFTYSHEQITPEGSTSENILQSLRHAKSKKADVALLYMKHNRHTRKTVEDGIKEFERVNQKSGYRFKQILIVTPDGRIHKHKHNQ